MNIYMTITAEQQKRLEDWKVANAANPTFQKLLVSAAMAYAAMLKVKNGGST